MVAILKITRTKHQNKDWLLLAYTAPWVVLPSHFNIAELFNDQILFSPVIFDWLIENEHYNRSFFLFDFLLYHYSNSCYFKSLLFCGKLKRNREKNKNKLRARYPKIMKILRAANLESNFTGSYQKRVYFYSI